jgi:hypothetical protein
LDFLVGAASAEFGVVSGATACLAGSSIG